MSIGQNTKALFGILFDFNGTLFFDSDMHFEAFRLCFDRYGISLPDENLEDFMVQKIVGRTTAAIFRQYFKPDATDKECEEFAIIKENYYYDICLSNPQKMKLVPYAEKMLDYIKNANIPYCIATGSGKREMDFFIEHLGLDRWFSYDNIVYTDGTFNGKPCPDCYLLAAKRLSLDPSNCIIFEDGTSGIKAANAANAGAVIVVYDNILPSPLCEGLRADGVYHDFSQWESIFRKYNLAR